MKITIILILMGGNIHVKKEPLPVVSLQNDTSQIHFLFHKLTYLIREGRFSEMEGLFDEKSISPGYLEKVVREINLRKNDKIFQKYSKGKKVARDFEAKVKSLNIKGDEADAEIELIFYIPYQLNTGGMKITSVSLSKIQGEWKIKNVRGIFKFLSKGWRTVEKTGGKNE